MLVTTGMLLLLLAPLPLLLPKAGVMLESLSEEVVLDAG